MLAFWGLPLTLVMEASPKEGHATEVWLVLEE